MALARSCLKLKSVNIGGCELIDDAFVVALLYMCPELKSVVGYFTIDEVTFTGERKLTYAMVDQIMSRPEAADLTELNFRWCELITDATILAIAESCPLLKIVDLAFSDRITDASVAVLARSCPQLESLNLSCCALLTDVSVTAFARNCPQLESVILYGSRHITGDAFAALKAAIPGVSVDRF